MRCYVALLRRTRYGRLMNLSSYLRKRPNSSKWQLRWMVPLAARSKLGKAEFTKTLGVTDRREAEALAYPILAGWRAQVRAALSLDAATSVADDARLATRMDVAAYLAGHYEMMNQVNGGFARLAIVEEGSTVANELAKLSEMRARLQQMQFVGSVDGYLDFPQAELADQGIIIPDDHKVRREYAKMSVQTLIDSIKSVEAEIEGRADVFAPSEFIVTAKAEASSPANAETVMIMFERYVAQRAMQGNKRADSIEQDRIVVQRFANFVGGKKAISMIAKRDVREWRDTIAMLPRNYTNTNAYKGMSMRAAAEKAVSLNAKPISASTQNKYMSTISPLFRWAVQNGYIDVNPCDGLFLNIDKNANPYPTFSIDELNKILLSPLFTGFLKDGAEHKPGECTAKDWRRWIPLLCLFTGSRIGEISQLRLRDIRHERGRWFLDIRNDPTTGQRTKSGKSRIVPLHRRLEAAGFVAFYENQMEAAGGNDRVLFEGVVTNERGHVGAAPSRFWRSYLGKIGLKHGGDGKGAHSFRHTLADELRAAGFMDDQFGPLILGHHKANVTAGYGRMPQGTADMLCGMIDGVKFAGVDFSGITPKSFISGNCEK